MFILEKKLPRNRIAFMINKSYREGKKVFAKTIKYFGIAHDEQEKKVLRKLAKVELNKLCPKPKKKLPDILSMREKFRVIEGVHEVFGKIFDSLQLQNVFSKIRYNQLRDIVIARIANPSSKLHTSQILNKFYQKDLSEDQIYNLMDVLIEHENNIKEKVFQATQSYSENKVVNLLLFDVTTLYFESQKADELKEFGYSKDHKVGEVQVVLSLATNDEGNPIGYQLFSGNTAEALTLIKSLKEWRKIIPIKNIRVIADRAMMSDKNMSNMENEKFEYIIAAKLKQLSKELKEEIWNLKQSFLTCNDDPVFIKELNYHGRRLIIGYSKTRAEKDKSDRERTLLKLKSKFKNGKTNTRRLITNNGYLKFIDDEKKGEVVLNEEKIAIEANWDGLYGHITNNYELSPVEVASQYRRLWIIEESFRLNKHSLSMRPIYHFKPRRIKAHILICYIAFALSRYVEKQIKTMSFEKIREELLHIEASIIEDPKTKDCYRIPSVMTQKSLEIYQKIGIKRSSRPCSFSI
jgi:transposase